MGTINKIPTLPPQRGDTHRVDTMAFRMLLGHLDVDWVVRSMEERDYGIDLQIEIFDGSNPTGLMVFGQLKGTENSFDQDPTFQFPVKTLLYAELFHAPFFLFRTSIKDGKTRFVWLQKLIEMNFSGIDQKWRSQGNVNISMPEGNDLLGNKSRFLELARAPLRQQQALQFLRIESLLTLHAPHVINGRQFNVGYYCSSEAKKLAALRDFIVGDDFQGEEHYDSLCKLYEIFDAIALGQEVTDQQKQAIEESLSLMEDIKILYLSEADIQGFVSAEGGVVYY